ncbi:16229_t:CDS:2, partial [Racocetra fulgida]
MTPGAQQALRRTMEIYSNTTRFALACNTSNKIIEPIQSRCTILKYSKLSDKAILKRLTEICKLEGVKYNPEGLEAIIFTAEGDMRQAINNLQSTFTGFSFVNAENVYKVCDQPHPAAVTKVLDDCYNYKVDEALTGLTELWEKGYSAMDIITTMFRVVKFNNEWQEGLKLDFIK